MHAIRFVSFFLGKGVWTRDEKQPGKLCQEGGGVQRGHGKF